MLRMRKIGRALLILLALMAKIWIGLLFMTAGTYFTVHSFSTTPIDDLRIGVLAMKFMGISFLVMSVGISLVAVQDAVEDSRYI